jgi:cyclase
MPFSRLIARLDVKGENVIKGLQMDGLRVIAPVEELSKRYYEQGADEIVILDTVASLYQRNLMKEIIKRVTSECFVPITIGGGIRTVEDADSLFRAGADKVALNTAALARPNLISEISSKYGCQATVIHIETKTSSTLGWECYTESGRQPSGISVLDWVRIAEQHGAGEFLVSSVDRDGMRKGMDIELFSKIRKTVTVPLVGSSGAGSVKDVVEAFRKSSCDGIAIGASLHWKKMTIADLRIGCHQAGIAVRPEGD